MLIAQLHVEPSCATRGQDGTFVVGTTDGRVLMVQADGRRRWIAEGTDGPITALAVADDGSHVLAAGGHRIAWWRVRPRVELQAELVGPQPITAAVLSPGDKTALFGTSQGHLLEWTLDGREAKPVAGLSCGALPADRRRSNLPPAKRCPYGSYVETPAGLGVCTYPLTHLVRRGGLIARACRTGIVALFHHGRPPQRYEQAGALGALGFVGNDRLLFARNDGELRLYDAKAGEVVATFNQKAPTLVGESAGLLAVASTNDVRLWQTDGSAVVGVLKLPARPIWISFREKTLELLLADGRLRRWSPRLNG